jgi:ribosomal protein L18E
MDSQDLPPNTLSRIEDLFAQANLPIVPGSVRWDGTLDKKTALDRLNWTFTRHPTTEEWDTAELIVQQVLGGN